MRFHTAIAGMIMASFVMGQASPVIALEVDEAYWRMIEKETASDVFEDYLKLFPDSRYADAAREKLKKLSAPGPVEPAVASDAKQPPQREDCGDGAECKKPPEPVPVTRDMPANDTARPAGQKPQGQVRAALDLAFWNSVAKSGNPELFKAYLKQFPSGVFAVIAREKLKTLAAQPQGQAAAKKAVVSGLRLSLAGVGNLTAKTSFTLPAIKKAFPGYDVRRHETSAEGMTEVDYTVVKGDNEILRVSGVDGRVLSVTVRHRLVEGPMGVRVGDSLGAVRAKLSLRDCMGGQGAMGRQVVCSPARDDDVFSFQFELKGPLPALGETQPLTAAMLNANLPLQSISWEPREGTAKPVGAQEPVAAPVDGSPLQRADAIMDRAYQMAPSEWSKQAKRAIPLYEQAARQGAAVGWFRIGQFYENGIGVGKDNSVAIRYYERAAADGHLQAYGQAMLVQDQVRNYSGAARLFFRYFKKDRKGALESLAGLSLAASRKVQAVLQSAGYYPGALDGKIGPATQKAIANYLSGEPRLPSGDNISASQADVHQIALQLQRQLRRAGCYHAPPDGKWGPNSVTAMRQFNSFTGRKLSVNKPTRRALKAVSSLKGQICIFD